MPSELINVFLFAGGTGGNAARRSLAGREGFLNVSHGCGTWDSGGGSGRLLAGGQIELPPGDVAQGILAASSWAEIDKAVYRHRDETGQSLINRLLVSYQDTYGSFKEAVKQCSRHFGCQGSVLTVTDNRTVLQATTPEGCVLTGEHEIDEYQGKIVNLSLLPYQDDQLIVNQEALQAIERADIFILGPGSWYTSIQPNFLVPQVKQAVHNSRAPIIGIANLANDAHTLDWTAHDYGSQFCQLVGRDIAYLVANSGQTPEWVEDLYTEEGQSIVRLGQASPDHHYNLVTRDLISKQDMRKPDNAGGVQRSILRHPPHHLGATLIDIIAELGFNRPW